MINKDLAIKRVKHMTKPCQGVLPIDGAGYEDNIPTAGDTGYGGIKMWLMQRITGERIHIQYWRFFRGWLFGWKRVRFGGITKPKTLLDRANES